MNAPRLTGISSMATRALLADLAAQAQHQGGIGITFESVGGVDAARRVADGEAFDLVVLASDAIDKLQAAGRLLLGSKTDLVRSGVAAAVRRGAPRPDIGSAEALRQALLAARSIGYSTGPSGSALLQLFDRWGLGDTLRARTVQAPPGVPVGALVARGEVELGFQQRSELMFLDGIDLLGPLPAEAQIVTTFSAAVCSASAEAATARELLALLNAPDTAAIKRRHGMEPAR
jgi:molybdate transport system substrate-binding protein